VTEIGSTLGGRYRLLELLGQGGMATIYRARDAQLERDVAVKLLRPEFGKDPDFLARFRDEARAAASLNHPNITAVFDFGEDVSGPYIVMELVDGQDLGAILRENGPLAPRQASRVAAEVAKALHAAHVRGFVHRDVKPSNVLVGRDGRVKVADFGIARALAESQLTMPSMTMGSVHYFSPEQARGEVATAASDIYALGIVLFEALTGQRPFSGDGAAAVALARLTTTPPRPSALRPGVPGPLDAIVLRSMALEPGARYATAAAVANALEVYLADPAAATSAAAAAAAAGAGATDAGRTVASARARPNPNVPYPPDAYARSAPPSAPVSMRGNPPPPPPQDDDNGGSGPWAWIAGLLGLGILIVVGFLVFQVLAGRGGGVKPSPSASAAQVEVPSFVDLLYVDAQTAATKVGLVVGVAGTEERTDVAPETVLSQQPLAGQTVDAGAQVNLIVARGKTAMAVPDLRGKTEAEALQLIVSEGLVIGSRAEAFDPLILLGSVVDQEPGPVDASNPRAQQALEALYEARFEKQGGVKAIKAEFEKAKEAKKESNRLLHAEMLERLTLQIPVAETELNQLAAARGEAVKQTLIKLGQVSADRISVGEPVRNEDGGKLVASKMNLGAGKQPAIGPVPAAKPSGVTP